MSKFLHSIGLLFNDSELEKDFKAQFASQRIAMLRLSIMLAAVSYALFGITDFASDSGGVVATRFRYMVGCPILILFVVTTFHRKIGDFFQIFSFVFSVLASILVFFSVILLNIDTEFTIDRGNATYNFLLVAAFGVAVPFSFISVVCFLCVIQVLHAALIFAYGNFSAQYDAIVLGFVSSASIVVGFAVYWRERNARVWYLEKLKFDKEREEHRTQLLAHISLEKVTRNVDPSRSIADVFGEVTVLFCDIVGFTQIAERISPKHLVELLGAIFNRLDEIAEKHGVEKVKTIGDAYMAIVGTNSAGQEDLLQNTTENMAEFALEIIQEAAALSDSLGMPIQFRVGMHTGSLIGGALGRGRRIYDYWGRTVNVASRLESTSETGRIHLSEATYWRLKTRYIVEQRGTTDLKGIGPAVTYYLVGPAEPSASNDWQK